ncbi:MAG: DNA topoisomerase [Vezdaea aestivalis]|nr:MAG: DNA topoisomerase [Vezdaea aestivalis]
MARRILCVAEKPSIAKAVANHLGGGRVTTKPIRGSPYVKNYEFSYNFGPSFGNTDCAVTMTSVSGHLASQDFPPQYRNWRSCASEILFDCEVVTFVDEDRKPVADNIAQLARYAQALFIWTDCDREGEHIGGEVRDVAVKSNAQIQIRRAKFSNIERAHILTAARRLGGLDERLINAVKARIELDLRIGAAFTRLQTLNLQSVTAALQDKVISYGSCQFPTLGFVVDRYFRVQEFVPEPFWGIRVMLRREGVDVIFSWNRHRLFDRMAVTILFERCLAAREARVIKVSQKPTSKWRPLPLTTVELQKLGSKWLRMTSDQVMTAAEKLYQQGFISYPRTETDQFDRGMDLQKLVEKQVPAPSWGAYSQGLLDGGFKWPRSGTNNDKAHPPIHPITFVAANRLESDEQRRVYEFVTRRFLGCCSEDAKGESTTVEALYGDEPFTALGLVVRQRNYLDVYIYEKWESSQPLPEFRTGERFEPTEANITDGRTTAPGYLTEPELIGLMDANGIGTDATMAEHIKRIQGRDYVRTQARSGAGREEGARGRGGGGRGPVMEFIPTTLGCALVKGYDRMGFDTSLSKPHLRKEMEIQMRAICAGSKTRSEVVQQSLDQYRDVFVRTKQQIEVLKSVSLF